MSDRERIKEMQAWIRDYSAKHDLPSIVELQNGTPEVEGVLNAHHKLRLQQMAAEHVKQNGKDINALINEGHGTEVGKGQILGSMSVVEMKIIEEMLGNYLEQQTNNEASITPASVR